jgi:hypothetical protein
MNKSIKDLEKLLPFKTKTLAGQDFFPSNSLWVLKDLSRVQKFDFDYFCELLDKELIIALKLISVKYLETKSLSHAGNIFDEFKSFVASIYKENNSQSISEITPAMILNYRASLSSKNEWRLGKLSGVFVKWYYLGYPGIEKYTVDLLKSIKFKGNFSGEAVRTLDPEKGPFSDIELESIQASLNSAYADSIINTNDFVLIWLYILFGGRNVQFSALKIKDFLRISSENSVKYELNISRAKQRFQNLRVEFKVRPVIEPIAKVIEKHIENVISDYKKLNINDGLDIEDLPIFPDWHKNNQHGFLHHSSSSSLRNKINRVFSILEVNSERTGAKIKISPMRFRYTIGTRAAQEGYGPLIIADLLDHSDTNNVGVYIEATPKIISRIDKAMAIQLAPLAQAFAGILINELPKDSDNLVRDISGTIDYAGKCGNYGFCNAYAPISCYTCRYFNAWIDGPHEIILDFLLKDRERILNITHDERVAATNDRTILAVAEVVNEILKIRGNGND